MYVKKNLNTLAGNGKISGHVSEYVLTGVNGGEEWMLEMELQFKIDVCIALYEKKRYPKEDMEKRSKGRNC